MSAVHEVNFGGPDGRSTDEPDAPAVVRVLLGHHDRLFRGGAARLLSGTGLEVVAQDGGAHDLAGEALRERPDVLLVDVRHAGPLGIDSLVAAVEIRRRAPRTAVLVLSDHYEPVLAPLLIGNRPEGVGYLLQHRITGLGQIREAIAQVAAGGSVLDPVVVARLLGQQVPDDPLSSLSPGQLDVLAAMAQGRSNRGIAETTHVSEASVEKHVTGVFRALGLVPSDRQHRRVRAVLVYLQAMGGHVPPG